MLFITNRKIEFSVKYFKFNLKDSQPKNNLIYGINPTDKEIGGSTETGEIYALYESIDSHDFMQQLKNCKAKHILFYIHGFDVLPNKALNEALKLQELFDAQQKDLIKIVPIIWPADDSTLEYWHAQKSADASAFGFHRALSKLAAWAIAQSKNNPCRKQLHILAHSMGARVLRESLIAYKKYDCPQGLPALFKNIFLAAPDLVNETLEYGKSGHVITECAKYLRLTYAHSDIALDGAKIANLRGRRLGHSGVEDIKKVSSNFHQIDCDEFNFKEDPKYGHTYFFHPDCIKYMFIAITK